MKNAIRLLCMIISMSVTSWAQPALNITSITPPRQVIPIGGNLILSVTATGATSHQWQRNGLLIPGATTANYQISNASPERDGGRYEVKIINDRTVPSETALSSTIFLMVGSPTSTRVVAWGDNSLGQTAVPSGLSGVVAISAGGTHTMALKSDGTVSSWGYNASGETNVPAGLSGVVAVSAGRAYSLALQPDGTVTGWGRSVSLPVTDITIPRAPFPYNQPSDIVSLAALDDVALALRRNGDVFANGNTVAPNTQQGSSVAALGQGHGRPVVLRTSGTVVEWTNRIDPTPVPTGLQNVISVVSGNSFTAALKKDGTVVAWGYNDYGEITVPNGLSGVVAIAAGSNHILALRQDGRVFAWGNNHFGQCNIPALGRVVAISAGHNFSVAAYDSTSDVLPPLPTSSLSNLSVRTTMAVGQTLTLGAVVIGGLKNVLVRAAGPALSAFGLTGMADPRLDLYTTGSTPTVSNDNWPISLAPTFTSVGAFRFANGSKDAALEQSVNGSFTIQARGTGPGVILVEAYDTAGGTFPRLVNVSARNQVGTGSDILIAGFTINGTGTKQVLVRAVGPTLTTFGVTSTLADPTLKVIDGRGVIIASNDNWDAALSTTFTQAGAFPLAVGSKDAALLVTLPAGSAYTVQVSGVNNSTGEALVEVYEVL